MDTISPAELRDHTSEILERVRHGDWFAVTDNGHVAAIISPPPANIVDGARQAWQPREARTDHWASALPRRPLAQTPQDLTSNARQEDPPGRHRR